MSIVADEIRNERNQFYKQLQEGLFGVSTRSEIITALDLGIISEKEYKFLLNNPPKNIQVRKRTLDENFEQALPTLQTRRKPKMTEPMDTTQVMADIRANPNLVHENDQSRPPGIYKTSTGQVLVSWAKSKDPINKEIMATLKQRFPKVWTSTGVSASLTNRFPYKDYGHQYIRRGFPATKNKYGLNYASANEQQREARKADGWYGPGMYSNTGYGAHGQGAYWGRQLGARAGSFLGSKIGMGDLGAELGGQLGDYGSDQLMKRARTHFGMTGRGAYATPSGIMGDTSGNLNLSNDQVNTNQLINHPNPSRVVGTIRDETNTITLTHSEYIGDITPTTANFQTQYFLAINPGLSGTFPWLSNLAQFYEEYEFTQLAFTVKSMVTDGNSAASGTVIMATQYNPINPAFTNKQNMENYDYASSSKVTADSHHGIECDPAKKGGTAIEYIRTGAVAANQDLKTYDLATFQLATTGASPNLTIGELWVSYQVVLRKTKIPQLGSTGRLNAVAVTGTATATIGSTNIFNGMVLTSNLDGFSTSGNTITFPNNIVNGSYIFSIAITASTTPTPAISATCNGGTVTSFGIVNAVMSGTVVIANTTGNPTSITFTATGVVGSACTLRLYQIYSAN